MKTPRLYFLAAFLLLLLVPQHSRASHMLGSDMGFKDSVTVTGMINVLVGVEEKGKPDVFLVYPNPVKNELIVRVVSGCESKRQTGFGHFCFEINFNRRRADSTENNIGIINILI